MFRYGQSVSTVYFFGNVYVSYHGIIYSVVHMLYRFFVFCNFFNQMLEVSDAIACSSCISSEQ